MVSGIPAVLGSAGMPETKTKPEQGFFGSAMLGDMPFGDTLLSGFRRRRCGVKI